MNKSLFIFFISGLVSISVYAQQKSYIYKDAKQPIEARIKDLLARMTPEDKAGQLNQINIELTSPADLVNDTDVKAKVQKVREGKAGSLYGLKGANQTRFFQKMAVEDSRLGIPVLYALDVIHGYKTVFPIPLAEACSWDLQLIENDESTAAKEASSAGIHWTLGPMCDISRDPRWGRVMEGAGEDPFLASKIAAARVKGFQGNLDSTHVLACVKHYGAYGAPEGGREYNNVDMSRYLLWDVYLQPYKAAVEAGAATVMNSFNVMDGVPASGNKYLVTDVLKNKWKFKGFLVSDWESFSEMVDHGYAADNKDAALKAFQAGSMMDMVSGITLQYLPELVKEGKIAMKDVDDAVSRILYFKFKLGLFDDPYKYCDEKRESQTLRAPAHLQQAKESAERSMVLLKNENHVLPLSKAIKNIAVIGHLANSQRDALDVWKGNGDSADVVTVLAGLKAKKDITADIQWSEGYDANGNTSETLIDEAVKICDNADVILVNVGISGKLAGEDCSLAEPVLPEGQIQLLKALQKTDKPIVALVSAGRPLVLTWLAQNVPAILECWLLGTEGGNAVADVVFGDYNPSGKTVMSFPYSVGQIPVYYDHKSTGRPATEKDTAWRSRYRDIPNDPLYPFGYGLSYTTFIYSDLKLSSTSVKTGEAVKATVTVTNTGKLDGEEVVQLYIRDVAASLVRPVKELKGFQKIMLKAGESKTVEFTLTDKELSFYDGEGNLRLEPGKFKVFAGGDSKNTLEAGFELH